MLYRAIVLTWAAGWTIDRLYEAGADETVTLLGQQLATPQAGAVLAAVGCTAVSLAILVQRALFPVKCVWQAWGACCCCCPPAAPRCKHCPHQPCTMHPLTAKRSGLTPLFACCAPPPAPPRLIQQAEQELDAAEGREAERAARRAPFGLAGSSLGAKDAKEKRRMRKVLEKVRRGGV